MGAITTTASSITCSLDRRTIAATAASALAAQVARSQPVFVAGCKPALALAFALASSSAAVTVATIALASAKPGASTSSCTTARFADGGTTPRGAAELNLFDRVCRLPMHRWRPANTLRERDDEPTVALGSDTNSNVDRLRGNLQSRRRSRLPGPIIAIRGVARQ